MKIVDAHHHFWDPAANYHPWLRDEPPIPFRYGDYSAIRGRFMPEDYDKAAEGWDVAATVTMEGEWNPADPTGEAVWMQKLADRISRPAAHVAQAWLDRGDLEQVLEVYAGLPIVRSVRHKPRANPRPGGPPGGMMDAEFRKGFHRLAGSGLMFDLQVPWWHLDEAVNMAGTAPEVPIILNHAGLPADRSTEAIDAWRAAIGRFAALPQASVKVSGLGLAGGGWDAAGNRDIIRICIDAFGPDRAMFASNYPVDSLCAGFGAIASGFAEAVSGFSGSEKAALFGGTAARVYGLDGIGPGG